MAVGKKTGGRAKGTPNKKTAATIAAVEAGGITPLEYMLKILRDETAGTEDRFAAATAAAPYCHARLAAVEHSGELAVTSHEAALDELDDEGEGDSAPAAR